MIPEGCVVNSSKSCAKTRIDAHSVCYWVGLGWCTGCNHALYFVFAHFGIFEEACDA